MKNMLKVAIAIILTLSLLCGTALACEENYSFDYSTAVVAATGGNSYIRSAPNLNGAVIGCLDRGDVATYCGYSEYDARGVRWDYIYYYGTMGWVSSRYTSMY